MRRHWPWILAFAVLLQACAKESVVLTPAVITVLTRANGVGLSSDPALLTPVLRVSSRLIAAARRSEPGTRARDVCWVIVVYENAARLQGFVRPDGAIVLSAGALRLLESEAGLAALLGHEFGHALAGERAPVSSPCVSPADLDGQPEPLFTYQEELQADERGLRLTAEAGYDPAELLRLWERLKEHDERTDGMLKHVMYDHRMEHIAQHLPDALLRYERANRAPQKALSSR